MTNEDAKEYAKNMSYRKATSIKLHELLDMAEQHERQVKYNVQN